MIQHEAHRLAERLAALPGAQRKVALQRMAAQGIAASTLPIVRYGRGEPPPASDAQRGLWLTWRLAPQSAAYNMAGVLVLRGALDAPALAGAIQDLALRHDVLRTAFRPDDEGELRQWVADAAPAVLAEQDLRGVPAPEREAAARAAAQSAAQQPFDLEQGPVWRVALLRLDDELHWLGIVVHHIAADGWSEAVLVQDLAALYAARANGRPATIGPLPIQYADFAIWQREWGAVGEMGRQFEHWKARLAGAHEAALPLPLDRPRPSARDDAGAAFAFSLDAATAKGLRQLAEAHGCTLFMVMLALLKSALSHVSGSGDVCVGTPVARRERPETHGLVGYLTNVLVLRTAVDLREDFVAMLAAVRATVLDAHANADCPFDRLVSALVAERVPGVHPLFQVKCAEQQDTEGLDRFGDLSVSAVDLDGDHAHFDLSFDFTARADEIACELVYATDIFDTGTVAQIGQLIGALAQRVARSPKLPLAELLPAKALSHTAGEAAEPVPSEDLLALWHRSVAEDASPAAVQCGEQALTRGQLDAMATRLAADLRARGVGPEVRVGVHAPRSVELVLGLLAVLKAGGVYVPLDPALPAERLAYQEEDSGMALLLSVATPSWNPAAPVLPLAVQKEDAASIPVPSVHAPVDPKQGAYLIYTSGSTGRPKGVVVSRGNLAQYVAGVLDRMALPTEARCMAMVSTVAADLGHTVLFGALGAGRLLHLVPHELAFDPDGFAAYMRRHSVDVLKIVPSHLQALLNAGVPQDVLPRHLLVLGGEATRWELLDRLDALRPAMRVMNHYGPTETTVGVLTQAADAARRSAGTLPLGRPLPQAAAWVLDSRLAPVPQGVAGELYLGGEGLARGYQRRPGQTAERFVASPFASGQRLYRTGDRVRMLDDGSLEFLGRVDDQVKIRGYRVELKEVAQALLAVAGVAEAEVVAREADDGEGRLQLHGYVVAAAGASLDGEGLRQQLAASLPDYMVPAAIVLLEAMPLNANGKVDRRGLPLPTAVAGATGEAPQGEVEQTLAAVWSDVLRVDRVARHDNFFQLGGDSVLSLLVVARARKRGLALTPKQLFESRDLAALAEVVRAVPSRSAGSPAMAPIPALSAEQRRGPLPASHAQARQWFLWQLDPHSSAYHVGGALRLQGPLDESALRSSFDALVTRHESLRTVFHSDAQGQVLQRVCDAAPLDVTVLALDEAQARDQVAALLDAPFDLENGPLLRVALIRLDDLQHLLVVVMHHIVSDGWSMQIVVDEFVAEYRARLTDAAPGPAPMPLPIQYADYTVWHRQWLAGGEQARQLQYWVERLGRQHPVLQLTTDHPRNADGQLHQAMHDIALPHDLAARLIQRAKASGVTPFMLLLAAWQALLHRYAGLSDIRVGVPVANRLRAEVQGVVGLFVNTQVLRGDVDSRMSLQALLMQAKDAVTNAQANADLPFEQLVEALQPERRLGQSPLFQVMHNHQREDDRALQQLPGLTIEPYALGEQAAQFELTLHTTERPGGQLAASLAYARELFEPGSIERMAGHYRAVLQALADRPELAVGDVAFEGVEVRWAENITRFAGVAPVHRLIAEQARRTPASVAVSFGDRSLSYAELDRQANRLAHRLIAEGVRPEVKVGVVLSRSIDLLVGLLGVLKAGGAYVPIDPDHPAQRIGYMLEDSGAAVLLTQPHLPRPQTPLPVVVIDGVSGEVTGQAADAPSHDPAVAVHGEHLAYAIYTSGSTGRPKSVMVRHQALSHFLFSMRDTPGLSADDVLVAVTASTFDIATLELYLPLMVGARIVLADRETVRDGAALAELVEASGATALQSTPAGWRMLRAGGWPRQALRGFKGLCGGEALQPDLAQDLRQVGVELWNMYGPTETTVWSAAARVLDDAPGIAGPIADTRLQVFDAALNAVAPNVPGELYIGGVGLARGYLDRPGLTAERFVATDGGQRLYRTGDLVQWRRDGSLEFLGRIDHQVKIRGWRIELGEIEAQLLAQPAVDQAVVVARDGAAGPRLVAYVAGTGVNADALKAALALHLPDYMVPSLIVSLATLPLNSNGKVDRKALPEPEVGEQRFEAPQGDAEVALAALWAELLGEPRIARHDDFFALGGHSLLATQLVSRVRSVLGGELKLRHVFERPQLHRMAQALAPRTVAAETPVARATDGAHQPLSFAQQRLWFLWKLDPAGSAFNVPVVFDLNGRLDLHAMRSALRDIVDRHAVLRTVFDEDAGEGRQIVLPAGVDVPLAVVPVAQVDDLTTIIDAEVRQPFDLATGPLLRASVLRLSDERHVLVVVMHHIVADGWSMGLLMNEFAQAYAAQVRGAAPSWPPLPIQYADFAVGQRQRLHGEHLDHLLAFWKATLTDVPPLGLPADKALPAQRRHPGGVVATTLDAGIAEGVRQVAASQGVTAFMVLLAAFSVAAAERSGQAKFFVGTDVANRQRQETESLVGFFVNQVPLAVDCASAPSLPELLQQLRDTVVDASDHQELPFDKLVESVRTGRRDARAPLFQVKVIHQEDAVVKVEMPGLSVEDVPLGAKDAELDLIVGFVTAPDRIELSIKYDREVFEDHTMESLGAEIAAVLRAALTQPQASLTVLRDTARAVRRDADARRADHRSSQLAGLRGGLKSRLSARAAPTQAQDA